MKVRAIWFANNDRLNRGRINTSEVLQAKRTDSTQAVIRARNMDWLSSCYDIIFGISIEVAGDDAHAFNKKGGVIFGEDSFSCKKRREKQKQLTQQEKKSHNPLN